MLNVLVARHAQSEWNAQGRWQGQADPPLSDLGRAQALAAVSHVGAFDAIVASDLDRALSTATILAERMGIGPVQVETAFRERCAGAYQGLTREEIEARFPGHLEARIPPPGWESDAEILSRVTDGLSRLLTQTPAGDVLVISHGGVIYTLEEHLGVPHERIANLGGRWLHHRGRDWSLGARVLLTPDPVTGEDIL